MTIVQVAVAGLHAAPDATSELIDEVLYGMHVDIIETEGEWLKVRTPYRYEGYCLASHCIDAPYEGKHRVIANFADVLAEAKIQSTRLLSLTRGATVEQLQVDEIEEGWASVRLIDGTIGFVRSAWLMPIPAVLTDEKALRERLVASAFTYSGTPYRWGGKSPLGIDCSGLCSMAYLLNGIYIYRDAKIVDDFPIRAIAKEALQKGDLIYFPGHIAMYIGNEEYIHSSLGGNTVQVNSLNPASPLYHETLATTITAYGSYFSS